MLYAGFSRITIEFAPLDKLGTGRAGFAQWLPHVGKRIVVQCTTYKAARRRPGAIESIVFGA